MPLIRRGSSQPVAVFISKAILKIYIPYALEPVCYLTGKPKSQYGFSELLG